ncbi:MAG: hypothetical protein ABEJ68_04030 [Halobacteriaceae archaeon]
MADDTHVHNPADDSDALSARAKWSIVAVVVACLVGAPLLILVRPPTFVPYRDAYMGLSLIPGLVLGAVGVWTAIR